MNSPTKTMTRPVGVAAGSRLRLESPPPLPGAVFHIFGADALRQSWLFVATPQFISRLVNSDLIERTKGYVQLVAACIRHKSDRPTRGAETPLRVRRTLPRLSGAGKLNRVTREHGVSAERAPMHTATRHAMAHRNPPWFSGHAEAQGAAGASAGLFKLGVWCALCVHAAFPTRCCDAIRLRELP
jgi:hypothetical protein